MMRVSPVVLARLCLASSPAGAQTTRQIFVDATSAAGAIRRPVGQVRTAIATFLETVERLLHRFGPHASARRQEASGVRGARPS